MVRAQAGDRRQARDTRPGRSGDGSAVYSNWRTRADGGMLSVREI
jgi:hypothetical protein